ncbi:MAG: zf-HC2 domain-containing protein [Acidobacteriota bacterium]|nr:zf-HC2 domain-containing protein [Acidobacteriota bacterium]
MCTEANNESLVGFLYGELAPDETRAVEAHLAGCAPCRAEVLGLRATRDDLLAWAPPECRDLPSSWAAAPPAPAPMARLGAWAPALGLAAAAMLLLALSASIANLEVRYDSQGLVVRTGSQTPAAAPVLDPVQPQATAASGVTAGDLAAFEARLRASFSEPADTGLTRASVSSTNPQLPRDVRRLIEESEERTRSEMAQRFLDIVTDFEGHRRADMMRVQQALGQLQRTNGAEAAQTRDIVNRLMLASTAGQQDPQR